MLGRRLTSAIVVLALALLQPVSGVALCFCVHPADGNEAVVAPHRVDECRSQTAPAGAAHCARADVPARACCSPAPEAPPAPEGVALLVAAGCTAAVSGGVDLPSIALPGSDTATSSCVPVLVLAPLPIHPRDAGVAAAASRPRAGPVPLYALGAAYLI
jgi:hypothetical protein